jgi:DNA-binding beta-propeller fold protein YncE
MRHYGIIVTVLVWLVTSIGQADAAKIRYLASVNTDESGVSLRFPTGVACGNDMIMVADSGNGRLLAGEIFEAQTPVLKTLTYPQIKAPIDVARLSTGDYLVLDGKLRQVAWIDGSYAFKGFLKLNEIPEASDAVIKALSLDTTNNIYLLDTFNEQVLVLDPLGKFIRSVVFPGDFGFMSDIVVSATGTIYLVDSVNNQVYAASPDKNEFSSIGSNFSEFATGLVSSDSGLFLIDRRSGRIILIGFDGNILEQKFGAGYENGQLRFPTALCLDSNKRLFVADQGNNRVQIFEIRQ